MYPNIPDSIPRLTLPTARLIVSTLLAGVVVGVVWGGGSVLATHRPDLGAGVLLGGAGSGVASALAILAIRPWRIRPLTTWPMLVLLATMVMGALSLGVGFLLHFATPLGSWSLWLCLVTAYWAQLAVVAGTYAAHVRQVQPSEVAEEPEEDPGA